MRPLTPEEKEASSQARKRANQVLSKQRRELEYKIRACTELDVLKKARLSLQLDSLSTVKGSPVILTDGVWTMILDYELFQRMIRSLRKRHTQVSLRAGGVLEIKHYAGFDSRERGEIELYELPAHQRVLLTNLPVVQMERGALI